MVPDAAPTGPRGQRAMGRRGTGMNKLSLWRQHISARLRGLPPAQETVPDPGQAGPEQEVRGPGPEVLDPEPEERDPEVEERDPELEEQRESALELERERARRGRRRLAVAGALFATLVLPRVADVPGYSGAAARPTPSPSASSVPAYPSAGTGSTPSPTSPSSSPSLPDRSAGRPLASPPGEPPSPGATEAATDDNSSARAFRSVQAGQCLTVHSDGTAWSRPAPTAATRVGCGDDRAFVRVTSVRQDQGGACPAGNGRAAWTHGGTSLCLTRQFRVDQCLLAESDDGQVRAALMSAPACSGQRPSGKYDRLLTVTAVQDADDAESGSCHDDDRSKGGEHSRYWTWKVDGEARTLCAADATE